MKVKIHRRVCTNVSNFLFKWMMNRLLVDHMTLVFPIFHDNGCGREKQQQPAENFT